jgi:hypothetical protein
MHTKLSPVNPLWFNQNDKTTTKTNHQVGKQYENNMKPSKTKS